MVPTLRAPFYPGIQNFPGSFVGNSLRTFTNGNTTNNDKSSFIFVPGVFPLGYFIWFVLPFQLLSPPSLRLSSCASDESHSFPRYQEAVRELRISGFS